MNSTAPPAPPAGYPGRAFLDALAAAIRRITWRVAAVTLAISASIDVWWLIWIGRDEGPARGYLSEVIASLLMAFSIMLTTFVADERVSRGARRLRAYALAVAGGSALAALAQWPIDHWLYVASPSNEPALPPAVIAARLFFEYLTWGGIIVFVYVNRRTALAAVTRMHAAQVQSAQAGKRAFESRLQALQARVEPQFLFNTLARVRDAYESDPARGASMLDNLSLYLRASLPHLRHSASTLAQELDLVRAYWSIMREHRDPPLAIAADETARSARMPAMVLLPLIDLLGAKRPLASTGAVEIAARPEAGMLHVEISSGESPGVGLDSDPALRDIRERLHELYGDRATVRTLSAGDRGLRIVTEIPYEAADGSYR